MDSTVIPDFLGVFNIQVLMHVVIKFSRICSCADVKNPDTRMQNFGNECWVMNNERSGSGLRAFPITHYALPDSTLAYNSPVSHA